MEQTDPPKSRLKGEMELDRISSLPNDVIDKILSCLTLKEAVRTSVLSSRWKDKWAMVSTLVFDENCCSRKSATFVNIVDHVLLSHIVPIHKFVLSHKRPVPTGDIDRWVLHQSRNSIKVFELETPFQHKNLKYKMPLCFYSYQDMIELKLSDCLLKPPAKFQGFRTLKRLTFRRVTMAQDVLDNLLCSPLLENLEVRRCTGFSHLNIDAPNLRFLSFSGGLQDVSLQNTLSLAVVHIHVSEVLNGEDCFSSLANFFGHLPHIQRLTISGLPISYLVFGGLPGRHPKSCPYLCFLHLTVSFNASEEILTTLYLLSCSPTLENLDVEVYQEGENIDIDEEANSWLDNLDDDRIFSFANLRFVQISEFSGSKAELDFIKFLLLNSPVLETMTIQAFSADGSAEVCKKLLQLRRTSSAEIIYLDP